MDGGQEVKNAFDISFRDYFLQLASDTIVDIYLYNFLIYSMFCGGGRFFFKIICLDWDFFLILHFVIVINFDLWKGIDFLRDECGTERKTMYVEVAFAFAETLS